MGMLTVTVSPVFSTPPFWSQLTRPVPFTAQAKVAVEPLVLLTTEVTVPTTVPVR